jgi:hypothetical protein
VPEAMLRSVPRSYNVLCAWSMMLRVIIIALLLLHLTGCSWLYARSSYDFVPLPGNNQIVYEVGAQDMAKLVDANFMASLSRVEKRQYMPFKDVKAIKVYVFNDRKRYANFSLASVLTRGSSATDEVYLSDKLRERIDTLPSILTHELSHVHTRQYTGTFKYVTDIPSWFLEGLAVSVSSGGGAENVSVEQAQTAIRETLRFKPEDTGRLIPRSAHSYGLEPHMYYRQASDFVDYLCKNNPNGFEAALKDVLNGDSFRDVWPKHYGKNIQILWLQYLVDIGA